MPKIHFETKLVKIGDMMILKLPESASKKLPSRGQVMVTGTLNEVPFKMPLEPDGNGSHWLQLDTSLLNAVKAKVGDGVTVELEPTKDWPEPEVPKDWQQAIAGAPRQVQDLWEQITPMARWEWIRWARATNNTETRK